MISICFCKLVKIILWSNIFDFIHSLEELKVGRSESIYLKSNIKKILSRAVIKHYLIQLDVLIWLLPEMIKSKIQNDVCSQQPPTQLHASICAW